MQAPTSGLFDFQFHTIGKEPSLLGRMHDQPSNHNHCDNQDSEETSDTHNAEAPESSRPLSRPTLLEALAPEDSDVPMLDAVVPEQSTRKVDIFAHKITLGGLPSQTTATSAAALAAEQPSTTSTSPNSPTLLYPFENNSASDVPQRVLSPLTVQIGSRSTSCNPVTTPFASLKNMHVRLSSAWSTLNDQNSVSIDSSSSASVSEKLSSALELARRAETLAQNSSSFAEAASTAIQASVDAARDSHIAAGNATSLVEESMSIVAARNAEQLEKETERLKTVLEMQADIDRIGEWISERERERERRLQAKEAREREAKELESQEKEARVKEANEKEQKEKEAREAKERDRDQQRQDRRDNDIAPVVPDTSTVHDPRSTPADTVMAGSSSDGTAAPYIDMIRKLLSLPPAEKSAMLEQLTTLVDVPNRTRDEYGSMSEKHLHHETEQERLRRIDQERQRKAEEEHKRAAAEQERIRRETQQLHALEEQKRKALEEKERQQRERDAIVEAELQRSRAEEEARIKKAEHEREEQQRAVAESKEKRLRAQLDEENRKRAMGEETRRRVSVLEYRQEQPKRVAPELTTSRPGGSIKAELQNTSPIVKAEDRQVSLGAGTVSPVIPSIATLPSASTSSQSPPTPSHPLPPRPIPSLPTSTNVIAQHTLVPALTAKEESKRAKKERAKSRKAEKKEQERAVSGNVPLGPAKTSITLGATNSKLGTADYAVLRSAAPGTRQRNTSGSTANRSSASNSPLATRVPELHPDSNDAASTTSSADAPLLHSSASNNTGNLSLQNSEPSHMPTTVQAANTRFIAESMQGKGKGKAKPKSEYDIPKIKAEDEEERNAIRGTTQMTPAAPPVVPSSVPPPLSITIPVPPTASASTPASRAAVTPVVSTTQSSSAVAGPAPRKRKVDEYGNKEPGLVSASAGSANVPKQVQQGLPAPLKSAPAITTTATSSTMASNPTRRPPPGALRTSDNIGAHSIMTDSLPPEGHNVSRFPIINYARSRARPIAPGVSTQTSRPAVSSPALAANPSFSDRPASTRAVCSPSPIAPNMGDGGWNNVRSSDEEMYNRRTADRRPFDHYSPRSPPPRSKSPSYFPRSPLSAGSPILHSPSPRLRERSRGRSRSPIRRRPASLSPARYHSPDRRDHVPRWDRSPPPTRPKRARLDRHRNLQSPQASTMTTQYAGHKRPRPDDDMDLPAPRRSFSSQRLSQPMETTQNHDFSPSPRSSYISSLSPSTYSPSYPDNADNGNGFSNQNQPYAYSPSHDIQTQLGSRLSNASASEADSMRNNGYASGAGYGGGTSDSAFHARRVIESDEPTHAFQRPRIHSRNTSARAMEHHSSSSHGQIPALAARMGSLPQTQSHSQPNHHPIRGSASRGRGRGRGRGGATNQNSRNQSLIDRLQASP